MNVKSIILNVLLVGWTCTYLFGQYTDQRFKESLYTLAPDFNTVDLEGDSIKLSDYRGKFVVLNFWNLKCGWCFYEIPDLNKLSIEYSDKNVVIITVTNDNVDELKNRLSITEKGYKFDRKFAGNDELNLPVIPNAKSISELYGVIANPITFYINQEGRIMDVLPCYSSLYLRQGSMTNYDIMKETLDVILTMSDTALSKNK